MSLQSWQEAQSKKAYSVEIFLQQKEEKIVQNHSRGNHSSFLGLFSLWGKCVLSRKLSVKHHRSSLVKGELSSNDSAFTAIIIVVIITIIITFFHIYSYNTIAATMSFTIYMTGTVTVLNTIRITSFNFHQNLRSQIVYYSILQMGSWKWEVK